VTIPAEFFLFRDKNEAILRSVVEMTDAAVPHLYGQVDARVCGDPFPGVVAGAAGDGGWGGGGPGFTRRQTFLAVNFSRRLLDLTGVRICLYSVASRPALSAAGQGAVIQLETENSPAVEFAADEMRPVRGVGFVAIAAVDPLRAAGTVAFVTGVFYVSAVQVLPPVTEVRSRLRRTLSEGCTLVAIETERVSPLALLQPALPAVSPCQECSLGRSVGVMAGQAPSLAHRFVYRCAGESVAGVAGLAKKADHRYEELSALEMAGLAFA